MAVDSSTLADEKYVVLTTRKKDGTTVPTPVWLAPLPDGAFGFTTDVTSGKVKRIRNFPDVTIQPSSARGAVKPGSAPIPVTASVLIGDDAAPVSAAIAAKYGFMVKVIHAADSVRRFVTRKDASPVCAVRIELAADHS